MKRFKQFTGLILFLALLHTFVDYIDFMAPSLLGSYVPFDMFNLLIAMCIVISSCYMLGYFYQKRVTKNIKYKYRPNLMSIFSFLGNVSFTGSVVGIIFIILTSPLTIYELSEVCKLLDIMLVASSIINSGVMFHLGRMIAFLEKGTEPLVNEIMQEIIDAENAKNK